MSVFLDWCVCLGLCVCVCIGVCRDVYIRVGMCVSGALCVWVCIYLESTLQYPATLGDLPNVHFSSCLYHFVSGGVYSHGMPSAKG